MASEIVKKQKLVSFLEKKAFDPILKASDKNMDESKKKKLHDVQKSTLSEKHRFEKYKSAKDVKSNFLQDLDSGAARKVNNELKDLGLPVLPDLKDEFLHLCERLAV